MAEKPDYLDNALLEQYAKAGLSVEFEDEPAEETPKKKKTPGRKPKQQQKNGKPAVQMSCVRNIPKCLLDFIRQEFRKAENNEDALVAFICTRYPEVMKDREVQAALTTRQEVLIDKRQDSEYGDLAATVRRMNAKLDKIAQSQSLLEMIVLYNLYDRLNRTPADVSLDEKPDKREVKAVLGLSKDIDALYEEYKAMKQYQDGKPWDF